MKEIPLTKGQVALVDDEDFIALSEYKWHLTRVGYAARNIYLPSGKQTLLLMHRVILQSPKGMFTDHINRCRVDNRKSNLRICTHRQNMWNRPVQKNTKSKLKGAYIDSRNGRYFSQINVGGRSVRLGYFNSAEEASFAYADIAQVVHGEFFCV